jgi:hypothetical protein
VLRKHSNPHGRYVLAGIQTLGFCAHYTRLSAEGVGGIQWLMVQGLQRRCSALAYVRLKIPSFEFYLSSRQLIIRWLKTVQR